MVAHLDQRGDLARAEHPARDHVGRRPRPGIEQDRAGRAFRRIEVPQRSRRQRALGVEYQRRGFVPDELRARPGEDLDLGVVGLHDLDVHQLRELVDIVVALVAQRRRGGVLDVRQAELLIDAGDVAHRRIGLIHRIGQAELGIAA
jgi:hypothetical protein